MEIFSTAKEKRIKRFLADSRIQKRRIIIAKGLHFTKKYNWLKRHPLYCGHSNCSLCSSPRKSKLIKGEEKLTLQERIAIEQKYCEDIQRKKVGENASGPF